VKRFVALLLLMSVLLVAGGANAGTYTITFTETGGNVVATGSGSLTGLTGPVVTNSSQPDVLSPTYGEVAFGSGNVDIYLGVTGPSSFGTGGNYTGPVIVSGDNVGFFALTTAFVVPTGYSGTQLTSTATYTGQTISSLGLTPGTYPYSLPGPNSVVITINAPVASPTATTDPATSITTTGVTLNGTVSSNGASTTVNFEYGLTSGYGSTVTASQSPLASGASSASVSAAVTGLTCNTQYHFRVNANNGTGGTINGSDATFTTSACPTYTIGGTISGLTGSGLVLTDSNAGTTSAISPSATSFTLPTAINSGTSYAVSVQTQATGQTCTVSNGTGTATANVTSVSVTCSDNPPPTPTITSITPIVQGLTIAFNTVTGASASSTVSIASVNYTAACTSNNGGVSGNGAGAASPITVTNLTAGKSYTCTVSATDTVGADHDDAGHDRNGWVLWLENEAAVMGCC
jgi:hypothetical protein